MKFLRSQIKPQIRVKLDLKYEIKLKMSNDGYDMIINNGDVMGGDGTNGMVNTWYYGRVNETFIPNPSKNWGMFGFMVGLLVGLTVISILGIFLCFKYCLNQHLRWPWNEKLDEYEYIAMTDEELPHRPAMDPWVITAGSVDQNQIDTGETMEQCESTMIEGTEPGNPTNTGCVCVCVSFQIRVINC